MKHVALVINLWLLHPPLCSLTPIFTRRSPKTHKQSPATSWQGKKMKSCFFCLLVLVTLKANYMYGSGLTLSTPLFQNKEIWTWICISLKTPCVCEWIRHGRDRRTSARRRTRGEQQPARREAAQLVRIMNSTNFNAHLSCNEIASGTAD